MLIVLFYLLSIFYRMYKYGLKGYYERRRQRRNERTDMINRFWNNYSII